jgi:hypothetical protein
MARRKCDVLIDDAVTGSTRGKQKNMVVTDVNSTARMLIVNPSPRGSAKERLLGKYLESRFR